MKEFITYLESELGLEKNAISSSDHLGFCEWWDSTNHVSVLLAISAWCEIELTVEMAERLTSIEQITEFVVANFSRDSQ